ncbi:hypothetical protein J5Y05_13570 [Streptomyces sp. RG38]|uniref:DUF3592 domain-containing protein n=1 Tax=Streptomyces tagetis TaxID=2820809 RepID=A0A941B130_9ACTN|nr:hypothetical protein [Streptomyces sp. RG38]
MVGSLVVALLLGALSLLVLFPAAQHLRSLRGGERVEATLVRQGGCMAGNCQVEFEAAGRTVVADLPVGSGAGKSSVGTRLPVRYRADDPQVVALDGDVGGGGAAVGAVMSAGGALLFLAVSVLAGISLLRQGRPDPADGPATSPDEPHAGE